MTDKQQLIVKNVEHNRPMILEAERWLWAHPQTGFTEWEANGYLTEKFESLGYTLTQAGNIPGFYTDIDTGKPGPTLCIMGELDALDIANHPESVNGMTHCCGHHAQGAALLGVAAALKEPGALDGLCGKIRLMMVPAEEMIQLGLLPALFSSVPSMAMGIAAYVLTALAYYTVANRRGLKNAWLAWIPVANLWLLGSISDQYRYVVKGEYKSKRKILLGLGIASGVAMALSAVFQGKAGAAGADALAETGKGFSQYITVVGLCETVALFALVFSMVALG